MKSIELIDALDQNGNPTGKQKTKAQIFNDGDWRNVAHVWIVNGKRELLVQRRAVKGLWDNMLDVSVGGGVSAGEDPLATAIRETREELGLRAGEDELRQIGTKWEVTKPIPERNQIAREFSSTYLLCVDVTIEDLQLQASEVASARYVALSEVEAQISEDETYALWVPHPKAYYLGALAQLEEII